MSPNPHPLTLLTLTITLLTLVSGQTASTTAAGDAAPSISGTSVEVAASTLAVSIDSSLPQTPLVTLTDGFTVPDLTAIVATATLQPSVALASTYAQGATPTIFANAPAIPAVQPQPTDYPALDKVPPTNSSEVQQWLSELDLSDVPDFNVTTGACGTSPEAAEDTSRCWWTCTGCTRPTDIVDCPTKYDWGLSHDDGPSPWTPALLDYLNEQNVKTTFFVVGSRVISRPEMLISEYMAGHQICVHTWSHPYLTTLTNEQIVAELGWSKQVIKATIGVTPAFFRPPYGDIDDRVRSIAAKMGLQPIIWSRAEGVPFDTTDWNIPAGTATGESCLSKFESILNLASSMDTGFIVLEHDLWPQTVDIAVGYVLPMALNSTSPFKLKNIASCLGIGQGDAYIETSSNGSMIIQTDESPATSTEFFTLNGAATSSGASQVVTTVTSGGSTVVETTAASASSGSSASASATTTHSGAMGLSVAGSVGLKGLVGLVAVALGAFVFL